MKNVRLSKYIIPLAYRIQLRPDLENFTFEGIETIDLKIKKPTRVITLHSREIKIDTADIIVGKKKIFSNNIAYSRRMETVTFTFPSAVNGKVKLRLVFRGILNDKMRGFYRSTYLVDKKEHYMATTQFEATDARRAFPCFDEPAQKAVFHISLVVPKGKTAISNTLPVSTTEHESGYEIIKFHPTPKMSTYLLAFIVGDFEYVEKKARNGVRVRIYTTPGKKDQAKFALECAVKTLEFYEKYFAIKYPLPVLDMIAIPDFSSGAMENWGAITYRESALLFDEKHSSASNKQWVALVIAHELAHQWFGNLVTMEWWTHLWLNEGFASYIEYLAVHKLFPEWDIWTQFSTNDLGVALGLDALESTHPIEVTVHHPSEIGEIFDEVSYSKGASVIRMLADYLGETDFRDGLRYYLKKHSYKNTETIHLWEAFEKISKKPVAKVMHNWTSKPGYPVIEASLVDGELELSQRRFLASEIVKKKLKDRTIWQVPISVGHNTTWLKVNIGEAGFYRTAYSKELLERLAEPVRKKLLSPRDRLGIVRDLFALAEAGVIPTTEALSFLRAYKGEDNYTVWLKIAMGLSRLEQILARAGAQRNLDRLTLDLFCPQVHRLGWSKKPDEKHADTLLRSLAISRAGLAGDKKVIREARKKFSDIRKGKYIYSDIRGSIYAVVATWGGKKEFEQMISLYQKETLHEEKNRIGNALGYFRNRDLLLKACEFSFSKNVRIQDTVGILNSVGVNTYGRDVWLNFIKTNWKEMLSRYGEGGFTLGRAVKAISGSAEERHFKDFKKFFRTHKAPGAKRAIDQSLERMEGHIAWLKRDGKEIAKFLEAETKRLKFTAKRPL